MFGVAQRIAVMMRIDIDLKVGDNGNVQRRGRWIRIRRVGGRIEMSLVITTRTIDRFTGRCGRRRCRGCCAARRRGSDHRGGARGRRIGPIVEQRGRNLFDFAQFRRGRTGLSAGLGGHFADFFRGILLFDRVQKVEFRRRIVFVLVDRPRIRMFDRAARMRRAFVLFDFAFAFRSRQPIDRLRTRRGDFRRFIGAELVVVVVHFVRLELCGQFRIL